MDSLYLVHHGVPFDIAFALDREERLHWVVTLGTIRGGAFDWSTRRWRDQD